MQAEIGSAGLPANNLCLDAGLHNSVKLSANMGRHCDLGCCTGYRFIYSFASVG